LSEDEILARLLALNLAQAVKEKELQPAKPRKGQREKGEGEMV
jgi:hypothetical protein